MDNAAQNLEQSSARELDPNVLQRRAANPESSVWVSASAGSGKTKVLTDRVLRLLLPRENGEPGTQPHKILGLTFTKAGANEMALRINETLSQWAIASDSDLQSKLKSLLGKTPNQHETNAARKLFAHVIDTPGRLKIMTIHAFCQSLLSRFPLEASLIPGFKTAEDREARDLLIQAKNTIFRTIQSDKTTPLYAALSNLSQTINENQMTDLIAAVASERQQLTKILAQNFGIDGYYTNLCQHMNVPPAISAKDILETFCSEKHTQTQDLKYCVGILSASDSKTDQKMTDALSQWLTADQSCRIQYFQTYKTIFLKADDTPRAKLITQKIADANPKLSEILEQEMLHIQTTHEQMKAAQTASLSRDLLLLTTEILSLYENLKAKQNILDYEDLIAKAAQLLKTSNEWVHFKLDEGIDHILIDEAQDTNPEQWNIIEALCTEFFSAHSQSEDNRTVFTVGDEKQSIYSFQRASPEDFERMQNHFADKITAAQKTWNRVDLNISFRSTKSVLQAVDAVFSDPATRKGLGTHDITHHAFRRGQEGHVELWPLYESDETEQSRPWDPPITIEDQQSGAAKLSTHIAKTIRYWLDENETLTAKGRAIEPSDIMVLVRTRNAFVGQLIRALKLQNIPVGGLDRLLLNNELAVQDLKSAAEIALLPQDDLTLACLLKSPLIGFNEDELFDLANDRPRTLYESVKAKNKAVFSYIQNLQAGSKTKTPYAFFSSLLHAPCPADTRSGLRAFKKRLGNDALDAIDEFLNAALNFEREHTPNLQHFLQWQSQGQADIKREAEDSANHVRIMTIHGAKGLQSPIVFLPDTIGMPGQNHARADNRLLWPSASELDLPIWAPRKEFETELYRKGKNTRNERLEEEYRRLLYVAMTRAEDRLYVAGYKAAREPAENCWYNMIKRGLENHSETTEKDGIISLSNPQTQPIEHTRKEEKTQEFEEPPEWLTQPAPEEPDPPAPLVPSRPSEKEPSTLSPLKSTNNNRFRRGNLTHTLLQFLPDLDTEHQKTAAMAYLQNHAKDLDETIQTSILEETFKILEHPNFASVFGPNSRAEVPITGLLPDGRLISGQIDRLLITPEKILIIDYKTNRPPPTDSKDVPALYIKQMRAYAETLKAIYPDRQIHCALLWTDGPNLMPLDIAID